MRRLLLGGLLACLPLALLAQPAEQPLHLAQTPDASRVILMPPSGGQDPQTPQDGTVTQMPAPDDQQPVPNDTVTAPPPLDNPAVQAPIDNSVIATPLPPAPPPDQPVTSPQQLVPNPLDTANAPPTPAPDQPVTSPQQLVPNPLDTANAPPAPAPGKPAQPQGQRETGGWVKMGTATLQALDKANAVEKTLVVKVGDTGRFDSLDIAVRGCFVRPPDKPADATAFLVIRDEHSDAPAFKGWMVRSAPYMSMMAHPIYDVRVAGCSP